MQIKNKTSSIGKLKKENPETYLGLNPQTPLLVKKISQLIKIAATKILAIKKASSSYKNLTGGEMKKVTEQLL